jgi:SAM-dependent methyltransferase
MNWRLKLLVQNAAGLTPLTADLYTYATTELLRTRVGEPRKWCQWYREHVILIRRHGELNLRGSRGWIIDSGFTLAAPILACLSGATTVFSGRRRFTLRSSYDDISFETVEKKLPKLARTLDCTADEAGRILELAKTPDPQALPSALNARFLSRHWPPPVDIPDSSLDFVISMGALEHYSPLDLQRLLAEMIRVLRPGGVMSHIVDHRDHSHHAQSRLSPLHHLKHSDTMWRLIARPPFSYTNRLLRSDYLRMFAELPLEVTYSGWDPHGRWEFDPRTFAPRFRDRPADDYEALVSHFVCTVNKTAVDR